MPVAQNLDVYFQRINRVLDEVDTQLEEPLDLVRLAASACFEPVHFHKVFLASLGETPAAYVRRIRLERAAATLMNPRASVLDVALEVGFGSGEAFARAFRQRFGHPPSAWQAGAHAVYRLKTMRHHQDWKQASQPLFSGSPWLPDTCSRQRSFALIDGFPLGIEGYRPDCSGFALRELAPQKIAYVRGRGAYGIPVRELWSRLIARLETPNILEEKRELIARWLDNPSITHVTLCRHEVGVVLRPDEQVPEGLNQRIVPGGLHLVCPFEGSPEVTQRLWRWIFAVWLPRNGLCVANALSFERFPLSENPFLHLPLVSHTAGELCVPVKEIGKP